MTSHRSHRLMNLTIVTLTGICQRSSLRGLGCLLFVRSSHMMPLGMTCTCQRPLCVSLYSFQDPVSTKAHTHTLYTHTIQSPPSRVLYDDFSSLNRHGHTKQTFTLHQRQMWPSLSVNCSTCHIWWDYRFLLVSYFRMTRREILNMPVITRLKHKPSR